MSDDSLYMELYSKLCGTRTVDSHEHLPSETEALERKMDFYSLFERYCVNDLVAAGASPEDMATWQDREKSVTDRWRSFKPYFLATRTTGYSRSVLMVFRDLLGFDDLSDNTVKPISRALAENNTPGLYDRLLLDRCNLSACIDCWHMETQGLPDYFYHVASAHVLVDVHEPEVLSRLREDLDQSIHTLDDLLDVMTCAVATWRANPKMVGIKSNHAYKRSLRFEQRDRHEADAAFNRLLKGKGEALTQHEAAPLQDYLMFQLFARADAEGLPMVFHTGLQAGNYGRISDANPLHLQSVLERFPRVKIDLYHGGMPWVRETAILARYFPGVHLNMAWMHIIDPAQARSALAEWLDSVPSTKIFGFGGDYGQVETVYGHLKLARQNIARVLTDKVRKGAYSLSEAEMLVERLMFSNPNEFYGLNLS